MTKCYLSVLLFFLFITTARSQTQVPLPPHGSNYNGTYARGYWFVAPTSFTITGLMVAPEAGTGQQYIHLMKCSGPMTGSGSANSNFVTLAYISGAANNTVQPVSITVNVGDTIGVLGTVTGICNSYTASGTYTTTIGGFTTNVNRGGYQGTIESGPAPTFWGNADGSAGELGRVFIYYTTGPCTDPPTAGTATTSAFSVCPGGSATLSVSGGTFGTGQTYVWESSFSSAGPFSPISTSSATPGFTVYPVASEYYRAAITCGLNTAYTLPIQVTINTGASGSYTIDATQPASAMNFTSFASAMASLACGVSGPVVFNVAPNSGPYNEQVTIPLIMGASATNTIKINGNGNTIQAIPVTGTRSLIRLEGADYVHIDSLTLISQSPTYGWGIHFMNGANYNTVTRCTINLNAVTSTSSSNSAGFVASNSASSAVTAGNNANYNVFDGNTIIGGYRAVSFIGNAGPLDCKGNIFTNNTIQDFYADGFYLVDNDSTVIAYNNMHRMNRAAVTSGAFIELGAVSKNCRFNANRLHDTHNTALTGTFYGIYLNDADAPAGSENIITNNLMYKFNSTSSTIYGFYNANSDGAWYFHNTVVLDHAAATSGTTRGFYQTGAASNIQIRNNIFHITRGGSGVKYILYFNTSTSSILSNNNDLYIAAPAGTNSVGYFGAAQATLAAWQGVNGGAYDQQSVSLNPTFQNAASDIYIPTNTLLDNLAAPLGITTDIAGSPRSPQQPDMGAYEFLTVPLSVKLSSITATAVDEDVTVRWTVSSEKNLDKYVVERSQDSEQFSAIGERKATGGSSYQFADLGARNFAIENRLYYRLRMIGEDGANEYSKVVTVDFTAKDQVISVYPNPFSDHVFIYSFMHHAGNCSIQIKNIEGRTVWQESRLVAVGGNELHLGGLGKLPAGVYQLLMEMNGRQISTRMVK